MPAIVFASNNISHWPLSRSSTLAGTFDTAKVPYSIELQENELITSPQFAPVAGNVSWIHFRYLFKDLSDAATSTFMKAYDANGVLLFEMYKQTFTPSTVAQVITKLYRDGGDVLGYMTFPFNEDLINGVDIRYENDGANVLTVNLYVNSGLAATATYAGTITAGQVAYFSVGSGFSYTPSPTLCYVSELLVTDGDTRNARLDLLRPTAAGGETDWVGIATDLGDDDPTSGMTSITAADRHTFIMSAYGGAANVSAIVVATQSMAGVNGPQNMQHTVRMGAVNYDGGTDIPLGDILQYNATDFPINPATSLPWVGGDLATMEMGFISKT